MDDRSGRGNLLHRGCKDAGIQGYKDASAELPSASLYPCISASVVECLAQLRSHSLVLIEEGTPDVRYRLLETLREFAAEQLTPDGRETLARRHFRY